ncbi:MAG: hypothetical protein Q8896_12515, partial [Bacteroidota bacterium]|nr:hypothetical protein [Bacteroidota bacterium]
CSSSEKPKNRDDAKIHAFRGIHGLYFGESRDSSARGVGWLIYVDSKKNTGAIYYPAYGIQKIDGLELDSSSSQLHFSSKVNHTGISLKFSGTVSSTAIDGILYESVGGKDRKYEISFHEIMQSMSGVNVKQQTGEILSNIQYNSEGGDLLGDELLLLNDSNKLRIISTTAEGEIVSRYISPSVVRSEDTILFTEPWFPGDSLCRIVLGSKKATLQRRESGVFGKASVLMNLGSIPSVFEKVALR